MEPTLITAAAVLFSRNGIAARTAWITARTFRSNTESISASSMSANGRRSISEPALLTRMSRPPSALRRLAHQALRRAALVEIRAQQENFRPVRFGLRRHRARFGFVPAIMDRNGAALRGERHGDGGADSRARTRDQHAFAGQVFDLHLRPLEMKSVDERFDVLALADQERVGHQLHRPPVDFGRTAAHRSAKRS